MEWKCAVLFIVLIINKTLGISVPKVELKSLFQLEKYFQSSLQNMRVIIYELPPNFNNQDKDKSNHTNNEDKILNSSFLWRGQAEFVIVEPLVT